MKVAVNKNEITSRDIFIVPLLTYD